MAGQISRQTDQQTGLILYPRLLMEKGNIFLQLRRGQLLVIYPVLLRPLTLSHAQNKLILTGVRVYRIVFPFPDFLSFKECQNLAESVNLPSTLYIPSVCTLSEKTAHPTEHLHLSEC